MAFGTTKISFLFCALSSQIAFAWQIQSGDFNVWSNSLVAPMQVAAQIDLFFQTQTSTAPNSYQPYTAAVPKLMKDKVISEMLRATSTVDGIQVKCTNSSSVNFPGTFQIAASAPIFEKELLRVESIDCLPQRDLDKVFNTFMSDDFQKKAISGLKSISSNQSTNQVCQTTKVFGIGSSAYCFTQNIWRGADTIIIHSFNETNSAGIEAPVYYREVATVFKKLKSGDILLYNLTYGRGPNLPFHGIVKGVVARQHTDLILILMEMSK